MTRGFTAPLAAGMFLVFSACGGPLPNLTITDSEVTMVLQDNDVTFSIGGSFKDRSFLVFEGYTNDSTRSLFSFILEGVSKGDARELTSEYPDIHLFSTPKSEGVQEYIQKLALVAADKGVLWDLGRLESKHNRKGTMGGERVWVRLSGSELALDSFIARRAGLDVTEDYTGLNYLLVTSLRTTGKEELEGD